MENKEKFDLINKLVNNNVLNFILRKKSFSMELNDEDEENQEDINKFKENISKDKEFNGFLLDFISNMTNYYTGGKVDGEYFKYIQEFKKINDIDNDFKVKVNSKLNILTSVSYDNIKKRCLNTDEEDKDYKSTLLQFQYSEPTGKIDKTITIELSKKDLLKLQETLSEIIKDL